MSATLPWFSRNAAALGAVALSVGVLAGCGASSSSPGVATAPGSGTTTKAPITIGVSLSLTGASSAGGIAFDQGYRLWARDVNAGGGIMGRQVSLVILNDDSMPGQAVTNYNTLIGTDHVDLTFGPSSPAQTAPAAAVAARAGYAFIEGAGGAPSVFDAKTSAADGNVFDVSLPVADELAPFVTYIASLGSRARGMTAAFPMAADDPLADPPVRLAETKLRALGVRPVYDQAFTAGPSSAARAAAIVAREHPDIVVLGSAGVPTVAAFMKEFRLKRYRPKLFIAVAGPDQGSAFTSAVGAGNAAGMLVPGGWYPGYVNAASEKMVAEYVQGYGGRPADVNPGVAEAFSVGQIAGQAMVATGGTNNAAIIKFLHSGLTLQTVQGGALFSAQGENNGAAAFVFQWNKTGTDLQQVLPANDGASVKLISPKPAWAGSAR